MQFKTLEQRVRKEDWWRFIFLNKGVKIKKAPTFLPPPNKGNVKKDKF